ncbi:peptidylprolyl isomerase [Candidatus Woesearchaeota archaeon]|nr:peptidylprolyl isomerase [Candidatus Woesearchaeota archaeon]
MKLKQKDFVELEYTGKVKEDSAVFDTTDEKVAKDNDIHQESASYGPVVVCLGQKYLVEGLEDELIGKGKGTYKIEIKPEKAFGKKSAKLLKLVPIKVFKKQNIEPFPGLQINIDGLNGTIRNVSGGRVIVDFNHPLAGREIEYEVKVNRLVESTDEKVKAILKLELNVGDADVKIADKKAIVKHELPKELADKVKNKILALVPDIKDIKFKKEEKTNI